MREPLVVHARHPSAALANGGRTHHLHVRATRSRGNRANVNLMRASLQKPDCAVIVK